MNILNRVWEGWKRIGQLIGDFLARIVLTIFYFSFFMPFGIGVKLFGDPLEIKAGHKNRWSDRTTRDLTIEDARRLF